MQCKLAISSTVYTQFSMEQTRSKSSMLARTPQLRPTGILAHEEQYGLKFVFRMRVVMLSNYTQETRLVIETCLVNIIKAHRAEGNRRTEEYDRITKISLSEY